MAALGEFRGQQDRKRRLVELDAFPEWAAVGIEVLRPMAVGVLHRDEVGQHPAGIVDLPDRQKREAGIHRVARPDQVVAAEVVARISPRHAQRGHDRAGKCPVLVGAQDRGGAPRLLDTAGGKAGFVRRDAGRPGFPPRQRRPAHDVVTGGDGRPRERSGALARAGKGEGNETLIGRKLAHERDVARSRATIRPGHRAVQVEVLPAIRGAGMSGTGAGEARACGKAEPHPAALGVELSSANAVFASLLGPRCGASRA